ncbi:unnamed protein product [Victoria cruziana]
MIPLLLHARISTMHESDLCIYADTYGVRCVLKLKGSSPSLIYTTLCCVPREESVLLKSKVHSSHLRILDFGNSLSFPTCSQSRLAVTLP